MWKSIIQDLISSGMTQAEIATAIDASQAAISGIYRGAIKEPSWSKGNALMRLHEERTSTQDKKAA